MQLQQRITPFLSYVDRAEEAAQFYVATFPDSKINRTVSNPMNGAVMTIEFELCGMKFVALNAGQDWKFTEAMSLAVWCDTQADIDRLWKSLLSDGGVELACGWVKDKFGMCWQIVPSQLSEWMASSDSAKINRMFGALWQMKKLDITKLKLAFEGV